MTARPTGAERLAKALAATNAAVVKLAEAIPLLVVVAEDDPLARDVRDALQLVRLSDAIVEKLLVREDGERG